MSVVQGKYVILELFITDTWYPLLCGTDLNFHVQQEVIYKTGPQSGAWREKVTRLSEWTATVTGLTKIENSTESLTFFHSLQEAVRFTVQEVRLTFQDDDGNGKQITGFALIISNDITGPATDFASATIVLEGTGPITMDEILPPVPKSESVHSDFWNTVDGQNYISGASANYLFVLGFDDEILEVDVEGTQYDVIPSGTPIGRQCRFTPANGRITFPAGLVFDGTQTVFVEFKRTI